MSNISLLIKEYRNKQGLSQSEFAQKLHVTKQAVSKWETGRGTPDVSLIPIIAKELGISIDELMGEETPTKKFRIIRYVLIGVLLVTTMIISPKVVSEYREQKQFNDFKESIENQTGLELPDNGTLVYTGFNSWRSFGNALPINNMSYLLFEETMQTDEFEFSLGDDARWVEEMNDDLLELTPSYVESYADKGDYYIIYNKDLDTYNETEVEPGSYEFVFIVYQEDNNRFLVFEYTKLIE